MQKTTAIRRILTTAVALAIPFKPLMIKILEVPRNVKNIVKIMTIASFGPTLIQLTKEMKVQICVTSKQVKEH